VSTEFEDILTLLTHNKEVQLFLSSIHNTPPPPLPYHSTTHSPSHGIHHRTMSQSPSTSGTTTPSNAGITLNEAGERIIPSSVRPDGTLRKEIKVRPGYRPPEDVEIYRNRAAASWKQRASDGKIPGAEPVESSTSNSTMSSSAKKNAKKREAAKKKKAAEECSGGAKKVEEKTKEEAKPNATAKTLKPDEMTEEEKEKAAKALRKKLRQAQDLKDKKEKGEALLPEQLEKVIKVNELMRQLKALGLGD
jgi:partner of Y14 and mago